MQSLVAVAWGLIEDLNVPVVKPLEPAFARLEALVVWKILGLKLDVLSGERLTASDQLFYMFNNFLFQIQIHDFPSGPDFPFGPFLPSANVVHTYVETTGNFAGCCLSWQVNEVLLLTLGQNLVLLGFELLKRGFFLF